MKRWYLEDELSLREIGNRLGRDLRMVHHVLKKHGVPMRSRGCRSHGAMNPAWRGGRTVDKSGYILIQCPGHPFADRHGRVREHRLVAERMIGRYLTPTEVVHHKDDDPGNNDPENLAVYETNAQHLADTLKGKVPDWSEDGRKRISEGARKPHRRGHNPGLSRSDDGRYTKTTGHSTDEPDIEPVVL
jgi:hypothetical protein